MEAPLKLELGQIIETKKNHPCGSNTFTLWRIGMDIGIECTKCKRRVMVPRSKIEKNIKKIIPIEHDSIK